MVLIEGKAVVRCPLQNKDVVVHKICVDCRRLKAFGIASRRPSIICREDKEPEELQAPRGPAWKFLPTVETEGFPLEENQAMTAARKTRDENIDRLAAKGLMSRQCHNLDGKECPGANASDCVARINRRACPTYSAEELEKIKRGS